MLERLHCRALALIPLLALGVAAAGEASPYALVYHQHPPCFGNGNVARDPSSGEWVCLCFPDFGTIRQDEPCRAPRHAFGYAVFLAASYAPAFPLQFVYLNYFTGTLLTVVLTVPFVTIAAFFAYVAMFKDQYGRNLYSYFEEAPLCGETWVKRIAGTYVATHIVLFSIAAVIFLFCLGTEDGSGVPMIGANFGMNDPFSTPSVLATPLSEAMIDAWT